MNAEITVVLADDHAAVLDSVGRMLDAQGIEVVACVDDGNAALDAIEEHRPTIAVVDIRMPKLSGVEVARRGGTLTTICVYTGHRERAHMLDAVAAGVRGIVLKEAPLADLAHAIRVLARGGAYFDPVLAGILMASDGLEQPAALSERERSVLRFLADGHRNETIGSALHIAPDTVRAHIRNAMRKLGAFTRTQAVATAMRRELID
jgi:DNA-binding NarL/FixJ family response regulator